MTDGVIQGDAAKIMGALAPATVDMIYSDPPFNTGQTWTGSAGSFSDIWTWSETSAAGWAALAERAPHAPAILELLCRTPADRAYFGFMAGLLCAARRALRPTGTLWLHFDDTAGAQLRVLGDLIFGPSNAVGVVIWKRTSSHSTRNGFGRVHDSIAVWGRTPVARWRLWRASGRGRGQLIHGDPITGLMVDGLLEDRLNARSSERIGYPTQKPVALLERLISEATLPGDMVLDPTCGSGTTLVAAKRLKRRYLGIDQSADAVATASKRLADPKPARQRELFGQAA